MTTHSWPLPDGADKSRKFWTKVEAIIARRRNTSPGP